MVKFQLSAKTGQHSMESYFLPKKNNFMVTVRPLNYQNLNVEFIRKRTIN